jgi:hypothetical protein
MSNELKTIFTLTVVNVVPEKSGGCIAWYASRDNALDAIESNLGDIHEGYFNYAVIEEVEEGQGCIAKVVAWFHWDKDYSKWMECERPKEFDGVCNWGIG